MKKTLNLFLASFAFFAGVNIYAHVVECGVIYTPYHVWTKHNVPANGEQFDFGSEIFGPATVSAMYHVHESGEQGSYLEMTLNGVRSTTYFPSNTTYVLSQGKIRFECEFKRSF